MNIVDLSGGGCPDQPDHEAEPGGGVGGGAEASVADHFHTPWVDNKFKLEILWEWRKYISG